MTNKNILPKRTILLSVGAILILLFAIGSIWDYPISKMLYSPENPFGKFMAAFGEYPMGLALAAAGAMLLSARNPEKKAVCVLQIVLGAFLILSSASTLVQIPARQSSLPILVTALLCVIIVGLTVWGVLRLCRGADRSTVIRVAVVFTLVVFLEMILVNVIKIPWGRARMRLVVADSRAYFMPWWQPGSELKDALVAAGVKAEEFKSFPSGHSANASCLMLLCLLPNICPKLEKKRTMLLFIGFGWACLVAFSRIVMGAHYLTDTVIGIAVGYAALLILSNVLLRQKKRILPEAGKK